MTRSDSVPQTPHPVLLAGPAAEAALAARIARLPRDTVFAFRAGRHPRGTDPHRLAYRLLAWLRARAGHAEPLPTGPEAIVERLPNWLARAAATGPVWIALAGVERLSGTLRDWLPGHLPPGASLWLATASSNLADAWAREGGLLESVDDAAAADWPVADGARAACLDRCWDLADSGRWAALREALNEATTLEALDTPDCRYDLHRWLREQAPSVGGVLGFFSPRVDALRATEGRAAAHALCDLAALCLAVDEEADVAGLHALAAERAPGDPRVVLAQAAWLNTRGAHDRARALLDAALATPPLDRGLLHALRHQRAVLAESTGDASRAETLYMQTLAAVEEAEGPTSPTLLPHLANLAGVQKARQNPQAAKPWLERAADIARGAFGPAHPTRAAAIDNLAGLHYALGDANTAAQLYREALGVLERAFGPTHPATAAGLHNLGTALDALSSYPEAEALHRRALAIREAAFGRQHVDTASSRHNLASVLDVAGRKEEAERLYREALADWQALVGEAHPATATTRNNLADLLAEAGRGGEAEPLYRTNLACFTRLFGTDHPHTQLTQIELGALCCALGATVEGEALLREAVTLTANVQGETSHAHVDAICKLSQALKRMGRVDEARALLDDALVRLEPRLGVISPRMLRLQKHRESLDRSDDALVLN